MTNLLDRVSEAYYGNMGEEFANKTRNRVNWVVNNVKGKKVLDIGCSQGIIPIILGREGKQVEAIDLAEESIKYAKNQLEQEHNTVQRNVIFRVSNFMEDYSLDNDYDTIILTEVLEHISDPHNFLEKVYSHLSENGILIVTVPFGINDYYDHKRTYYLVELSEQLLKYFSIDKLEFLGKWTGVVCAMNTPLSSESYYNKDLMNKLEDAFYVIERDYINKIKSFQQNINTKNKRIEELINERANLLDKNKDLQESLSRYIEKITQNSNDYLEKFETFQFEKDKEILKLKTLIREYQKKLANEKNINEALVEKINDILSSVSTNNKIKITRIAKEINVDSELTLKKNSEGILSNEDVIEDSTLKSLIQHVNKINYELLNSLKREEVAIQSALNAIEKNKKQTNEINNLMSKYRDLERKYKALKNSKLGKLTLKYWNIKKKRTNKIKE